MDMPMNADNETARDRERRAVLRSTEPDAAWRSAAKWSAIMVAVAVVIGGSALAFVAFAPNKQTKPPTIVIPAHVMKPEPVVERRAIDGMPLAEGAVQPSYYAVMIDNLTDARPQAGPSKASLVIEAPVEGGITRLLAIFSSDAQVRRIGPVRSARPYYVDWAKEYDALYAHVGGSPEALRYLQDGGFRDFNEYANGRYFWRDASRKAPHQVFTSTDLLGKGAVGSTDVGSSPDPWRFKDLPAADARPKTAHDLLVDYGSPSYAVMWKYDQESGGYRRYQGGRQQFEEGGQAVLAANVAVQFTDVVSIDDVDRKRVTTSGSGKAVVVRDGIAVAGTWKKSSGERTKFFDASGKEVEFNAGPTWIEVVNNASTVSY